MKSICPKRDVQHSRVIKKRRAQIQVSCGGHSTDYSAAGHRIIQKAGRTIVTFSHIYQFAGTSDFIIFSICNPMSGSATFFAAVCSHIVPATRWTYGWNCLKDLILFKDFGVAEIFYFLTAVYLSRCFLTNLAL